MKEKWNHPASGKHGTKRHIIRLEVEVMTGAQDSLEVLAHSLSGDVVTALIDTHEVSCRLKFVGADNREVELGGSEPTNRAIAKLTPKEDRAWEKVFGFYVDEGHPDDEAAELAWKDLQEEFPRLAAFEGCK